MMPPTGLTPPSRLAWLPKPLMSAAEKQHPLPFCLLEVSRTGLPVLGGPHSYLLRSQVGSI